MPHQDLCIVFCTGQLSEARDLSRALVEARLVACVNLVPGVTSYYMWKGEFCEDQEALLILKTRQPLLTPLMQSIRERHSYETIEILSVHIDAGDPKYMDWVRQATQPS